MKLQKLAVILAALTIAGGFLGLSMVATFQAGTINDQGKTISAQGETIGTLATNSDALRDQVKDSGETPVAPPADVVTDAPTNGLDGARGLTGVRGETGATGTDGIAGLAGTPGATGMSGLSGVSGADGSDSTTAGPQGATGADSTVAGPAGPTGPGIASVACQADGRWLFTLTDQTTREVAGPCRVDPITTPSEGATP